MSKTIQHNASAAAYAKSLLELATAKGQHEQIGAELADIRQVMRDNKGFELFLQDPAVSRESHLKAVRSIFAGRVNPLIVNTMGVMSQKGRLGDFAQTCDAYQALLDAQLGKIEVDVTVARKLSSEELETVRQRISQALKRDAVMHQYVDESIIGGIIIRVQDQLIDGSVRKQLETLRGKMLASKP